MAAAMRVALVCAGSNVTTARPRARFTWQDCTPATPRTARSTCETQLAQSIPLTENAASSRLGATSTDIDGLYDSIPRRDRMFASSNEGGSDARVGPSGHFEVSWSRSLLLAVILPRLELLDVPVRVRL